MIRFLTLILFLYFSNLNAQIFHPQTTINKAAEIIIDKNDKDKILESVDRFLNCINRNQIDSLVYDTEYFNHEKSLFFVLNENIQKSGLSQAPYFYKPIINYAERINSNYLIKVAFIGIDSTQIPILKQVQSLLLKPNNHGLFHIYSPFLYQTAKWESKRIGPITYFYDEYFDENKAQEMISASNLLSKLLKVPIQEITYYKFKNPKELFDQIGADYIHNKYWSSQGGFVIDKNIYAGNNSESYIHELVHIYTRAKELDSKKLSFWADEGLATALGGSGNDSYNSLLQKIKLKNLNNRDLLKDLYDVYSNDISDGFPIGYTLNAFVINLILKQNNQNLLMHFLYNDGSFGSYLDLIEKHLNIPKEQFNQRIIELINNS